MIGLLNVVIYSNLFSRYQFTARNVTAIVNQIGADDNIYTNVSKLIIRERYEDGSELIREYGKILYFPMKK